MKYGFIRTHEYLFPIEKMCSVLGVGTSGYFKWKSRAKSSRLLLKEKIKGEISSIYFASKQRYGSPRITAELGAGGLKVSRPTVAKYMRELGLRSRLGKKFKATTNSKHNYLVAGNVLGRDFSVTGPSKAWVSDITYIRTAEGFLYLTTVIDLYDRKIIGWSLGSGMGAEKTSLAAWRMAVRGRKFEKGLVFHSDRGVQYACNKFAKTLESRGVTRSMSRKGDCWDNAVAESFFKSLKTELIYGNKLISREKMELEIFEYIEIWYNKKRRHSALGYKTIEEFNNQKKLYQNVA